MHGVIYVHGQTRTGPHTEDSAMTRTYLITLADNSKHYVSASSAKSARNKLATRFPSLAVKSCVACSEK